MSADATSAPRDWGSAWLDVVAFVGGLALAWFGHWQTKDLVWSLWLSSLLVGYAMIVWMIFSPALFIVTRAWTDRGTLPSSPVGNVAGGAAIYLVIGGFMLAFFTFHFGMFHFVHSVFLNTFFPMLPGENHGPSFALYAKVLAAYWPFVLVAAVAERQAFYWTEVVKPEPETKVTTIDVTARKAKAAMSGMDGMMKPYRNVIRLHLLIFFFAFASFAKIDNFAVYVVVYAVYFFPWRLVKKA